MRKRQRGASSRNVEKKDKNGDRKKNAVPLDNIYPQVYHLSRTRSRKRSLSLSLSRYIRLMTMYARRTYSLFGTRARRNAFVAARMCNVCASGRRGTAAEFDERYISTSFAHAVHYGKYVRADRVRILIVPMCVFRQPNSTSKHSHAYDCSPTGRRNAQLR